MLVRVVCCVSNGSIVLLETLRSTTATVDEKVTANITWLYHKYLRLFSLVYVLQYWLSILKINWYDRFQSEKRE